MLILVQISLLQKINIFIFTQGWIKLDNWVEQAKTITLAIMLYIKKYFKSRFIFKIYHYKLSSTLKT